MELRSQKRIRLIVGLGNAGAAYRSHRHNIGACFVEAFISDLEHALGRKTASQEAKQLCIRRTFLSAEELLCLAPDASHSQEGPQAGPVGMELLFLSPQSYMNHSGRPVSQILAYFCLRAEDILVVHDEIDLAWNEVRFKSGGGHRGHNGLRDIILRIGAGFDRIRIGVGRPEKKEEVARYVLSDFTKEEQGSFAKVFDTSKDFCIHWLVKGAALA